MTLLKQSPLAKTARSPTLAGHPHVSSGQPETI